MDDTVKTVFHVKDGFVAAIRLFPKTEKLDLQM